MVADQRGVRLLAIAYTCVVARKKKQRPAQFIIWITQTARASTCLANVYATVHGETEKLTLFVCGPTDSIIN